MQISKIVLLVTAMSGSQTALADDLLNRLEEASERIGANQSEFYVNRAPELKGKLPSWEWDDEMRSASECVLEGIATAKGDAVAEAYVAGLETASKKPLLSMTQLSDQTSVPDELKGDDTTMLDLMRTCNTIGISTQRLKDSGAWDLMLDPNVMKKLIEE